MQGDRNCRCVWTCLISGLKGVWTSEVCGVPKAIWLASDHALLHLCPPHCHGSVCKGGRAGASLSGELTLSFPQGSLLKVVLEDYLRLKKLFAQRMVQKASSCHSSISEVAR